MAVREQQSFCRICVAMCGIVVTVDEPEQGRPHVVRVRGDADHPLSRGYVCPKGRALPRYHHHPDRLDHPLLRSASDGVLRVANWDDTLDDVAAIVHRIVDEHGPDAVATYLGSGIGFDATGRPTAERFLRALGSSQKYTSMTIDTPCKPLIGELVGGWSGLMATLDPDTTGLVMFIGTNPVVSHGHSNGFPDPVQRLRELAARGADLWVLDPRRTETAALVVSLGGRHLQPRPSTDWLVLAHLLRELLRPGGGADASELATAARADDLQTVRDAVEPYTVDVVADRSGLTGDDLTALLDAVRASGGLSVLTGTGTSMQQAANVTEWLVWVLLIVRGSLDRPGGMWFNPGFLRQAHRFPPRQGVSSQGRGPASRPELSRRFGELPAAALISEIEAGNVRVLFVVGGSPLTAFPEPHRAAAAFARLDALVVIDVVANETSAMATHVLPAADQLERDDVPIVADGLQLAVAAQFTAAVVPLAEEHRPVWWMFAELAARLGLPSILPAGHDPSSATDEVLLASLLTRAALDLDGLRAHPTSVVVEPPVFGWVHDSLLVDGRWQLAPEPLVAPLRAHGGTTSPDLVLLPRRLTGVMNSQLRGVTEPDADGVHLHPDDAAAHDILDGHDVIVRSAHGEIIAVAHLDERNRPGAVSITHGWAAPSTGQLASTDADVDPLTGMVCFSGVAITVSPVLEAAGVGAGPGPALEGA